RGGPVVVRARKADGAVAFDPDGLEPRYTLEQLAARGYTPATPVTGTPKATLLTLDGVAGKEYWIGFNNFHAITRYNTSRHYAMAVYELAEAIAGRDPLAARNALGDGGA